jgi:hypothetical protein
MKKGKPQITLITRIFFLCALCVLCGKIRIAGESGYGRYDIMLIHRDQSKLGFIIEFKKARPKETLETAVKSALEQIEAKKYESELLQRGIKNYKKLAIVFKGKEVTVKEG